MTTAVLVHGNPETAAIWGPLLALLERDDVVTLSPPGFGAPVPEGFGATADEYAEWLASELAKFDGPVDLVGHDWGGGHVVRVACDHPELIRSWCTDIAGCFAPDYVWHDFAQAWQTPGVGEEAVAGQVAGDPKDQAALYQSLGMTSDVAMQLAQAFDETMGRCILSLYRSAAQPAMSRWGENLPAAKARPGLRGHIHRRRGAGPGLGRPSRRPSRGARWPRPLVDVAGPEAGGRRPPALLEQPRLTSETA